jgi:hypothetical protein
MIFTHVLRHCAPVNTRMTFDWYITLLRLYLIHALPLIRILRTLLFALAYCFLLFISMHYLHLLFSGSFFLTLILFLPYSCLILPFSRLTLHPVSCYLLLYPLPFIIFYRLLYFIALLRALALAHFSTELRHPAPCSNPRETAGGRKRSENSALRRDSNSVLSISSGKA